MTKDELLFKIETKQALEFTYKNLSYNLTYGVDNDGKEYISFGRTFEGKKYYSFKELMNKAKIENSFFREMLDIL